MLWASVPDSKYLSLFREWVRMAMVARHVPPVFIPLPKTQSVCVKWITECERMMLDKEPAAQDRLLSEPEGILLLEPQSR